MMETLKKKDYGKVARKASKLLKEGVGIAEIINSANRKFNILNRTNNNISEKNS